MDLEVLPEFEVWKSRSYDLCWKRIIYCCTGIEGSNESASTFEERVMLCYNTAIENPRTRDVQQGTTFTF